MHHKGALKDNYKVNKMKTNLNQVCTIVGFFSTTIFATIAMSWGMINLFVEPEKCSTYGDKNILMHAVKSSKDLKQALKFKIPKLK
jgi:hypothetical protein